MTRGQKPWTPVQKACKLHAMDAREAIMSNLAAAVDADPRKDASIAEAAFPWKKPKAAVNTLNRMLDGKSLTVENITRMSIGLGVELDSLTSVARAVVREMGDPS